MTSPLPGAGRQPPGAGSPMPGANRPLPGAGRPLTCISCTHYRTTGCAKQEPGWPTEELEGCWGASYEPGSDEREDWEIPAGQSAGSEPTSNTTINP